MPTSGALSRACVTVLLLLQSACASAPKGAGDPSGQYRVEAWAGEQVFTGSLLLERTGDGWRGQLSFDASPPLRTLRLNVDGGSVRLVAQGPGNMVRVQATLSRRELRGTWSSGQLSGVFRGRLSEGFSEARVVP